MQVTQKNLSDTKVELTLIADGKLMQGAKTQALERLSVDVKLPGFRKGKAPLNLIEKSVDATALQTDFLDIAMNELYGQALQHQKLRPVAQPKVNVKKFVPFETLEMVAEVEVVGAIKLADYKKIKIAKEAVKVDAKEVEEVLQNVQVREAQKTTVDRASKEGDEVVISFKGVDAKTREPIAGADGSDYPLVIGSNTFIPGFEPELIGLKTGDEKSFDITFPKDYGVKDLQNRKVTFTVRVSKVSEVKQPKLDDALAAKVGPFKNVAELKEDIKKQLLAEKDNQADRDFTDQVVLKIAKDSQVALPKLLIDEQVERMLTEQKQSLLYRGQTWQEFLENIGKTEDEFRTSLAGDAELRVKAGIVLGEIAETEKVTITPEEFELRMQLLKGQNPDPQAQADLDKPETRRDILSRLLTEKTIALLRDYAAPTAKPSKTAAKPKASAKKASK